MKLCIAEDPKDLPNSTQSFLEANELSNNIPLGILNRLRNNPKAYQGFKLYSLIDDDDRTLAYGHWTPPHPLALAAATQPAITAFAKAIRQENPQLSGISGPKDCIERFLEEWPELKPKITRTERMGAYRLDKVVPPRPSQAVIGPAVESDLDLVLRWRHAFDQDCQLISLPDEEAKSWAIDRIAHQEIYLARVGNVPVSSAIAGRILKTGRSVGFVYTPPEHRGCGYASHLVADLSQRILNEGYQFCCLFTQLENLTSNKIYQNIGYQWCEEFVHYHF
ncbi:GNAT family N-acetyltransferase [Pseudobacteriovorax antillogorgiicola]|uniref:N-acetyltransferase domain-containing protein n=1 Tax=Pseudobacteriovorax antillogorgiicola TaxID=1513793 RepID=A0A1Y6BAI3_9BACT|nr:GNAT family N-acetyltransferase [Pseudobacteriovorax antillogorgiicola]TCS57397.1 hypothetical protein EDD56_103137 [Pseudobacteriovorax antillogorgiicola]SMF01590.1 hypothetical protein SAMN06296036_103196 [Pseudobacteriovorax antillogorgiicola]